MAIYFGTDGIRGIANDFWTMSSLSSAVMRSRR